jgi:hypothetical protein
MDLTKKYGSLDAKTQAEWVKWDDAELLVAPENNLAFQSASLHEFRISDIDGEGLSDRSAHEVVTLDAKLKAKTILLDWKNVFIDGSEIPYSEEKAVEILTDYPQFREAVEDFARKLADTRQKAIAKTKKK